MNQIALLHHQRVEAFHLVKRRLLFPIAGSLSYRGYLSVWGISFASSTNIDRRLSRMFLIVLLWTLHLQATCDWFLWSKYRCSMRRSSNSSRLFRLFSVVKIFTSWVYGRSKVSASASSRPNWLVVAQRVISLFTIRITWSFWLSFSFGNLRVVVSKYWPKAAQDNLINMSFILIWYYK